MPEWLPMLESVKFLDKEARLSEWTLKIPRLFFRLAQSVGFGNLVRWTARHRVEAPQFLWWESLSGFPNAGEMTFEAVDGDATKTQVKLQMTYMVPNAAAPLVTNVLSKRFMSYTVRRTMERFKKKMEQEAKEGS